MFSGVWKISVVSRSFQSQRTHFVLRGSMCHCQTKSNWFLCSKPTVGSCLRSFLIIVYISFPTTILSWTELSFLVDFLPTFVFLWTLPSFITEERKIVVVCDYRLNSEALRLSSSGTILRSWHDESTSNVSWIIKFRWAWCFLHLNIVPFCALQMHTENLFKTYVWSGFW